MENQYLCFQFPITPNLSLEHGQETYCINVDYLCIIK